MRRRRARMGGRRQWMNGALDPQIGTALKILKVDIIPAKRGQFFSIKQTTFQYETKARPSNDPGDAAMSAERYPDWSEEEVIAISAISHFLYCPRQYALIHIEGVFADNHLTAGGTIGHQTVDRERDYSERGVRRESSVRVFSDRLGISGIADLVEFPVDGPPYPVEYKHGRVKSWLNHEAQLCALAMCLEEMYNASIERGAIYHLASHRRHEVALGKELRLRTEQAIAEIRAIQVAATLPAPDFGAKCRLCSLKAICQPAAVLPAAQELYQPAVLYG